MTAQSLRDRIAAALLARIKQAVIHPGTPLFGGGMQHLMAANEYDLADAVLPLLADEREAHPPMHRWHAEVLDGDHWMPYSTAKSDRAAAVRLLRAGETSRPRWDDGTPVQRRLVRETTTYTAEDTEPARADTTHPGGQP